MLNRQKDDVSSLHRYQMAALIVDKVIKGFEYDDPLKTSFSLLDIEIMLQSEFQSKGDNFVILFEPLFENFDTVEMKQIEDFLKYLQIYSASLEDQEFQNQIR